ncbi:MAG: HlyD family efflux transporter periplasmic adaptor subunit [Bacteroidales bacterium]|jgi:HlyD family secretion protein|nr:HlyD family efflux transporter periplasmic adaptor subunit [Bacteroidales bacterium]
MNIKTYFGSIAFIMLLFIASCTNDLNTSDAYGNFEVKKTMVSAEGNGKLLSFNLDDGQLLQKGEVIGQIDSMVLYLQKEQLLAQKRATLSGLNDIDAQLDVLNQQKVNLQINKDRIDRLFEAKAATKKQVDDLQAQFDLLEKQKIATKIQKLRLFDQVKVFDRQVDLLNLSIQKCSIESPIEGRVLNTLSREGEMVGIGKPLFSIANLDLLDLKVYVSGAQLPFVKIGKEVEVYIDKNQEENEMLSGRIGWIAETAEFTPKTIQTKEERVNLVYAVKIQVKNDGRIKVGMPGEVVFPSLKLIDTEE